MKNIRWFDFTTGTILWLNYDKAHVSVTLLTFKKRILSSTKRENDRQRQKGAHGSQFLINKSKCELTFEKKEHKPWKRCVCRRCQTNAKKPGTQNAFTACRGQKNKKVLWPCHRSSAAVDELRQALNQLVQVYTPLRLAKHFLKHKLIRADLRSPVVRRPSAIDMMSDLAQLAVGRQEAGWICGGSTAPRRNSTPRALTRGRLALCCLSTPSSQSVWPDLWPLTSKRPSFSPWLWRLRPAKLIRLHKPHWQEIVWNEAAHLKS